MRLRVVLDPIQLSCYHAIFPWTIDLLGNYFDFCLVEKRINMKEGVADFWIGDRVQGSQKIWNLSKVLNNIFFLVKFTSNIVVDVYRRLPSSPTIDPEHWPNHRKSTKISFLEVQRSISCKRNMRPTIIIDHSIRCEISQGITIVRNFLTKNTYYSKNLELGGRNLS